jgi:hypothetical protein
MTIIAALTDGRTTWLGSDRLLGGEKKLIAGDSAKWTVFDRWAVASTGASFKHHIIESCWSDISPSGTSKTSTYDLGQVIIKQFKKHGISPEIDEETRVQKWGGQIIIARAGLVIEYDESMCPSTAIPGELVTCGSGWSFAMAAGWALQNVAQEYAPDSIISMAVKAACRFDESCEGEWYSRLEPTS